MMGCACIQKQSKPVLTKKYSLGKVEVNKRAPKIDPHDPYVYQKKVNNQTYQELLEYRQGKQIRQISKMLPVILEGFSSQFPLKQCEKIEEQKFEENHRKEEKIPSITSIQCKPGLVSNPQFDQTIQNNNKNQKIALQQTYQSS